MDILPDPRIREELSGLSGWPTIPQLFVRGELVGGCDIVTEMFESGELAETLGAEQPERAEAAAPPRPRHSPRPCRSNSRRRGRRPRPRAPLHGGTGQCRTALGERNGSTASMDAIDVLDEPESTRGARGVRPHARAVLSGPARGRRCPSACSARRPSSRRSTSSCADPRRGPDRLPRDPGRQRGLPVLAAQRAAGRLVARSAGRLCRARPRGLS